MAWKPSAIIAIIFKNPRITGSPAIGYRSLSGWFSDSSVTISPSGLRTAIQDFRGPFIMMPSSTAWPPMLVL